MNKNKDVGIGAILAILVPGAGYVYAGKIGLGLLLFVGISIGYVLGILPGMIFHLISIIGTIGLINKNNEK